MTTVTRPAPTTPMPVSARAVSPGVHVRRRLVLVLSLVLLVTLAAMALGGSRAGAELADPVAGHVVVAPGETLWDVAVATAPAGVDARDQVRRIQELNGLDGADLAVWTVLLIPAR